MKKQKVVLLDQAQIGRILKSGGFAALDAVIGRGDKFLFAAQAFRADQDFKKISKSERAAFKAWLQEKTYAGKVVTVGDIKTTSRKEQKGYDPEGRAGRRGTNKELWDMSARKFMLENQDIYDFEVISADHAFLDNRVGKHHPLKRIHFERVSMKSLMSWLLVHPNVDLTAANFNSIRETALKGHFGESHHLEKLQPDVPESYEAALRLKEEARQTNVLEDRQKGKTNRTRAAKKGGKLFDLGAPIMITGAAAFAMHELITREVKESGLSYQEAARELGIDFSKEKLKDLAAEAGIDLAITLTPIGPLKKAWDVLGNIDDIVSLMQLYGAAYPENATIQQMAALADELEGSAALAAYVDGRDALTGAIGGAIDFVLGNAESEEEAAEAIGKVRSAILEGSEELGEAAAKGAGREELLNLLLQRADASGPALLAEPDFRDPHFSPERVLEREAPLSNVEQIPGSDPILPPTLSPGLSGRDGAWFEEEGPPQGVGFNGEAPAGAEFIRKTSLSFSPAAGDAAQASPGVDPYARKTSYDRDRKLGRTPEEEAEALAEFEDLLREAYVVTGDMFMARGMASAQLKVEWGSSVFAAEEGTVMKYPVEKAYIDPEEDGHGYVRSDVETLLASAGIKARRWYLEPNGKTAEDRFRGSMDEDGYGPRMTLSYDDEAGRRHVVTEGFQAHVAGARQRRQAVEDRKLQDLAREYGLEPPEPPEVNPFQALRDGLAREASFPELRQQAQEKRDRAAQAVREPSEAVAKEPLKTPPPNVQPIRVLPDNPPPIGGNQTSQHHQGGANRPFSLPEGD